MLSLIPEKVNFEISTTDVIVKYKERSPLILTLDILTLEQYIKRNNYSTININFNSVAELRCSSLNFFEAFYNGFKIFRVNDIEDDFLFWKKNNYHPNSGFYQVDNSNWIKRKKKLYDPQGKLDLKHFLITGNDSYVEVLAKDYEIR